MTKWLIGSAVAALAATAALAQMPMRKDVREMMPRGPETRADVEARVKAHFAEVDANKDGAITRDETEAFKAAQAAKMRDKMFDSIDANHDGAISRDEMAAHHDKMPKGMNMGAGMMMHGDMPPPPPGEMGAPGAPMMKRVIIRHGGGDMFGQADANKDGKVTQVEARTAALAAFDKADANKDGTLTPEERKGAMKTVIRERIIERRHK